MKKSIVNSTWCLRVGTLGPDCLELQGQLYHLLALGFWASDSASCVSFLTILIVPVPRVLMRIWLVSGYKVFKTMPGT